MKVFRQFSKVLAIAIISAAVVFSGCSQNNPVSSIDNNTVVEGVIHKNNEKDKDSDPAPNVYPMIGEVTLYYDKEIGGYESGNIELANKSKFKIRAGSVTPPAGHPDKKLLTITMHVDRDEETGNLIFSFGPHGTQFAPNAEIEFNWSDLGTPSARLYYIDDNTGEYLRQKPDHVDLKNKKIYLYVSHFSRYMLAHS